MIPEWADQLRELADPVGWVAKRYPSCQRRGLMGIASLHPSYEAIQKSNADAHARASEQAFRILLKFRGNVRCDVMFYPRSIEEDGMKKFGYVIAALGATHHRGAVDCERRDRRDQAWRLPRPSPWLWRACRIPRTSRPRLPSRMAPWSSRQGRGHQEASLLSLNRRGPVHRQNRAFRRSLLKLKMAPRGAIFFVTVAVSREARKSQL